MLRGQAENVVVSSIHPIIPMFFPAGVYVATHLGSVTGRGWIWTAILFIIMMLICIPLTETPLKKWVAKQEKGNFAFADAKYYEKYPSFWKK